MKIMDFLGKLLTRKNGDGQTIVVEIPQTIYYKELALYTATSLIANAVSRCEFRVFINGQRIKNEDYYRLNVAPNKNENANYFWHKVIRKMIRNPDGALVVELSNGEIYCADSYNIIEERPVRGNIYGDIVLGDNLTLRKHYTAEEIYLFKMEDESVKALIDGLYEDYGKLIKSAARAFLDTNGRKFKFKVDSAKAGDEDFNNEFKTVISKNIADYMKNEYATYVEYEGEELVEESNKTGKTPDDVIKLRKDIFDIVGQALKIPQSLMTGSVTSIKDVCDIFLTFAVDPFVDTITEVLNKRATMREFLKGNYYKVYSGKVRHRDLFDAAAGAEKLLSSSVLTPDQMMEELDIPPTGEEWAKKHYITKNWEEIERFLKNANTDGGGKP